MKIESNWKIFERTFYVTFILRTLDRYINMKLQNAPFKSKVQIIFSTIKDKKNITDRDRKIIAK